MVKYTSYDFPNVDIVEKAVVCAGAVVIKDAHPYTIVAGIPAKPIGKRSGNLNYSNNGLYLLTKQKYRYD